MRPLLFMLNGVAIGFKALKLLGSVMEDRQTLFDETKANTDPHTSTPSLLVLTNSLFPVTTHLWFSYIASN
eukprot:1156329-Pelagomonas_calceolata.AAC.4